MKNRLKTKPKKRRAAKRKVQVQDRYEGAWQSWGDRSYLPAAIQDARLDADSSTRLELVRRSRYWERNNAIVNRLCDVFEQYTVGHNGLAVIPAGDDPDWIQAASQWWAGWCKFPDANSGLGIGAMQSLMARTWFVDGECFIYKTFSRESGRPRIQLIEGHRIGTPPHLRSEEGKSIVDGVEFKVDSDNQPVGKPVRYWLRTDPVAFGAPNWGAASSQAMWKPLDGDRIIQLYEPSRAGMCRGLPFLSAVMNDLHDLDDLQSLEMKAAKAAAEVANVVTNKTGEANLAASRRQKWQIQSQDASGNPVNKTAPLFYETTVGGRTIFISNGEKFEQFRSQRPGVATQDYWDYLVRKICAGVGISAMLVMPFSLQGTVTRADLDVAAAFFKSRSTILAEVMREIYLWVMSWAVKYDQSLDGAPAEWWHVVVRPPRSITVDVGRNSTAVLEELEGGTRTFQDVCAEMGHDWRHVLRQKAIEAKYIDDLTTEFGISRNHVSQLAKESVSAVSVDNQGESDAKDLKPPKEKPVADQVKEAVQAWRNSSRQWVVERNGDGTITGYKEKMNHGE